MKNAAFAVEVINGYLTYNMFEVSRLLDEERKGFEHTIESMTRARISTPRWMISQVDKKEDLKTIAVENGVPTQMFEDMWQLYVSDLKVLNSLFYRDCENFFK